MSGLIQDGMGFGKMANAKVPKLKYQAKRYEEFLKKKLLNSQKQSVCLEKFNHHRDHFEIVLSQVYGLSAYSLLYFIKINFQDSTMSGKIIFKNNEMYKTIKTKKLILLLLRYLLAMNRIYGSSYTFFINTDNGFIQCKFNFQISDDFTSLISFLFQQVQGMQIFTKKFFFLILHFMNETPQNFLQLINKRFPLFSQQLKFEKDIYKMNYKHLMLSIVDVFGSESNSLNNKKTEKVQMHEKIRNKNRFRLEQNTKKIFHLNEKIEQDIKYEVDPTEYSNLKTNFLNLPAITAKYPENPFIFNEIRLTSDQYQFHNLNIEGGRNKILLSQFQFNYVQSGQNKKNQALKKKVGSLDQLNKPIAIKVPKFDPPSRVDIQKMNHEVEIVKLLGCSKSIFFPRFYTCTQEKFKYKNHLLMDFLFPAFPLNRFLKMNDHSISFISEIYLMVNLMESLRVLKQKEIVHMDLSMNNVLVNGNLLTKLIDFGESYHKNVPNPPNVQHGFTCPYVFPERFSSKAYSCDSDTYSFGIILFKTLFQTAPYSSSNSMLQHLKNGNYHKKIYFSPQSLHYSGYQQQISLVMQFIFKCLSQNEIQRPQRSWSIIFLKQIFYWVQDFYGLM